MLPGPADHQPGKVVRGGTEFCEALPFFLRSFLLSLVQKIKGDGGGKPAEIVARRYPGDLIESREIGGVEFAGLGERAPPVIPVAVDLLQRRQPADSRADVRPCSREVEQQKNGGELSRLVT